MAHNELALPLYELGEKATEAMGTLAETGIADDLVILYTQFATQGVNRDSVSIQSFAPQQLGETLTFEVEINPLYPLVSFASMLVNTNDAFVGVSGLRLTEAVTLLAPAYDAGTEWNNELCSYIPGPACNMTSGNLRSTENAEGVVRILLMALCNLSNLFQVAS